MRWLAATFLLWAAVDWPTWLLDRAGVALAGFGFMALALAPRPRRIRRPAIFRPPPLSVELPEPAADELDDLVARIAAYSGEEPGTS